MNDHQQPLLIERETPELEARGQRYHEAFRVPHRAVRAYHDRDFLALARRRGVDHLELRDPDLPERVVAHLVLRPLRTVGEALVHPSLEHIRVDLKLLADFVDRGEIDDVQADRDVERLAVVRRRLQDRIGRDASRSLRRARRRRRQRRRHEKDRDRKKNAPRRIPAQPSGASILSARTSRSNSSPESSFSAIAASRSVIFSA